MGATDWGKGAVVCFLLLAACAAEEPPPEPGVRPVPAAKVGDIGEIQRRSFPGRARATQEVDLSFRVNGPLITLPVLVGSQVAQGEVLARIDPRDFEVRLRNADGQLQRARANLDRADSEYQRLQGIRAKDPQLVSEVQLERAREAFELALADTSALEATVDGARDALAYTHLKAPFDGAVVATYVQNFEYVQARQAVVRMLDRRSVEFEIQIPETLISYVPHLTNIRVRFDAFPDRELEAQVLEVGTEASALTRTYPVTLIMDQPGDAEILPGMAGKATGVARPPGEEDDVNIVVPVTAVYSTQAGGDSFVWIIDQASGTVSSRQVTPGELVSGGMSITEGLSAGELIATAGVNFLEEGQQVRPLLDAAGYAR